MHMPLDPESKIISHGGKSQAWRRRRGVKCPSSGFWFASENFFLAMTLLDEVICLLNDVPSNLNAMTRTTPLSGTYH
ncbi:hypothetical protein [Absidia glauca]|uniref:Uncharacterized protein n=1 Tax=Absidia glauca TaxID=4829 RepID=A0A163JDI1_ABSGL|nr:hypothetical protein [Absidia glauca]